MIRINLLPPEIIEKRRDEKRWRWVFAGALGVVVLLVGFYLIMFYLVTVKTADVAQIEQEAASLQARADQVKIFQVRQDELKLRQSIVESALAGRVSWHQMFYEVSLVWPNDLYLQNVTGVEDDPLTADVNESSVQFVGFALDDPNDSPDLGYKSVAKLMVRLADLSALQRVWLASAVKQVISPDKPEPPEKFTVDSQTPQTEMPSPAAGSPAPAEHPVGETMGGSVA